MDNNRKKELISSLSNDEDFNTKSSRKERKNQKRQQKYESKLLKELEKKKLKRARQEEKLSHQSNLDATKSVKELEDTLKLHSKQINELKREKEKAKQFQLTEEEIFSPTKKTWGKLSKTYFVFFFLLIVGFLGYNIYDSFHRIDQVYQIINSVLISLFVVFFLLSSLIVKESAKKKMTIFTTFIMVGFIIFQVLITTKTIILPRQAYMKDFSNQEIAKVITWASENRVKLEYEYDYSDTIKNNKVIRQDVVPNTLVKEIKKLNIVVSGGPNFEQSLSLPDMTGWNVDEVVKIIKKNKLKQVTIQYEFSEEKRDILISQSISGEIRRNAPVEFKFSLGKEEDLVPVVMTDLTDMEEFDATLWLKRNGIQYEIKYEFNNQVKKGHVIETTPKEGVLVNQKETKAIIVISKGKKIEAPDFTAMSVEEISKWADKNQVTINFGSEYDDKIKAGKVKRASVKKGDMVEEGQIIHIITSKGPLKMISYTKEELDKIKTFAAAHNISLNITEQYSDLPTGQIIDISVKAGDYLVEGQGIDITVSKGKAIQVPNMVGMSGANAQNVCRNAGLTCKLNYAYSKETKGNVIHQDTNAGAEVMNGTTITLTISNGPKPTGGGSSNNNGGGNGSNSGGSSNPGGGNTTPSCDKSKGSALNIQAGTTGAQTKSMIIQLNPNHKFGWNFVDSCPNGASTPGTICSAFDGVWKNYCDPITITIVR